MGLTRFNLMKSNSKEKKCDACFTVALAGNPNVGKSTVFNALTGMNQHTGNWPGKTVTNAEGICTFNGCKYKLVDLPGTYSLLASSTEEEIARDYIKSNSADCIVIVADATCLQRNLNLTVQILSITSKVIVCVNLLDEAKKKGIEVNLDELSLNLGVPVIGTAARSKKGLDKLLLTLESVCQGKTKCFNVKSLTENICINCNLTQNQRDLIAADIDKKCEKIYNECVINTKPDYTARDRKLDRLFTSKLTGIPIMICLFGIIFWITIEGANYPSQWLSCLFDYIKDILSQFLNFICTPHWLSGLIIDGVYTTLAWVVSVMLPPMAIFFPLFSLLEDSGYLPRIAFNMDNYFKKCNAHGKQSLTMAMGFGCNACGVIGCRIIDSPRERLIAILTNNFVPCNGRLPTLIAIISMFFTASYIGFAQGLISTLILLGVIILGILMTLLVSKLLSLTVLKGLPSSFILELPPYRRPQIAKTIVRSIFDRTIFVLGRAVMIAIPAGALIWILANTYINDITLLKYCTDFFEPFGQIIGLDGVIVIAFILGFPANEIVIPIILMCYMATGSLTDYSSLGSLYSLLIDNGWTLTTALCTMIMCLFHFPCSTTCLTIKKETKSLKWTFLSIVIPTVIGIIICFLINLISCIL